MKTTSWTDGKSITDTKELRSRLRQERGIIYDLPNRASGTKIMTTFQPIKVGVFGSCVTRDNFNGIFNPGYKDVFECNLLADHVSLVSLMAPPVDFNLDELDGLDARIQNNIAREFNRSFLDELQEDPPQYLIMDFWPDISFGFALLNQGEIVTHNAWSTTKTKFFKSKSARWLRPDIEYEEFFSDGEAPPTRSWCSLNRESHLLN